MRPPINPEGRTMAIGITIPRSLEKKILNWAAKRGMSRSAAITEAVRKLLEKDGERSDSEVSLPS